MNTIDWGKIYCFSHWGDDKNKFTIQNEIAPDCFVESIECGDPTAYTGGQSFPTILNVNLGTSTGVVTLTFDAIGIPDKFIVKYDGDEVINTGYRGNTSNQAALDAELASRGLPPETIISPPNGTATFNKTKTVQTAQILVYAPLFGTGWNLTLSCPI